MAYPATDATNAPGWQAGPMRSAALLIVDAANVVGSRPDGWWRDRAGATVRLRDRLAPLASTGHRDLPPPLEVVLVVEGAARDVAASAGIRVVSAPGSGDDTIVELVRSAGPERCCVVVTADRGLRARVAALGAQVRGPSWLNTPGTGRHAGTPPGPVTDGEPDERPRR